MMRAMAYFCILFLLAQITGCKKEDPNPELLDPIYKDLDKRAADFQKAYDDEIKHQEETRSAISKAEPNSTEVRNARRDLAKSLVTARELEQKAHYFKIRATRRLFTDRIEYRAAFAKNEIWPNPREYSEYQVNMRLQEAPMNWNTRVPKLKDRIVSAGGKPSGEQKKAEKGEE
jgi:hypothetical protein